MPFLPDVTAGKEGFSYLCNKMKFWFMLLVKQKTETVSFCACFVSCNLWNDNY